MNSRKKRLSLPGAVVFFLLMVWVGPLQAGDAGFLAGWHLPSMQLTAAQPGSKPSVMQQVQASPLYNKLNDIKKFAMIWALMILAGLLVWYLWHKNKSWTHREMMSLDEEPVAVTGHQVTYGEVNPIREKLLAAAIDWQEKYSVAPVTLSVIATLDAALLVGMTDESYAYYMQERGFLPVVKVDFIHEGVRYLVKAYRQFNPLGRPVVRHVPKAQHMDWDFIIFVLYDPHYAIIGAWQISMHEYLQQCEAKEKLKSEDYQIGKKIYSGSM